MTRLRLLMPVLLLVCTSACDAADAQPARRVAVAANTGVLVPPPGFTAAVVSSDKDRHACPTDAQPFTAPLDFPSRYEGSDKARDDVNEASEKEYKRLIAPITALEKGLSVQVDDYLRAGHPESLACATQLLRTWSSSNALMGEAITHTGKSMRKWAMASVAAAYLRLKFSASQPLAADPELTRAVERWLETMATRVVTEWEDQPLDKVNNHEYWAAWAVTAAAVAVNRRDLFDWAMRQFGIAATQVDAQGYLPNELKRDTRALMYHNYALTPLTMIAAFAKANGVPPGTAQREALARLAERVLDGVENPAPFEKRTGKKQVVKELAERSKFAWLEPYCWTFDCGDAARARLADLRPVKSYRLGGNLTEIFRPDASAPKAESESTHQPHPQHASTSLHRPESPSWTVHPVSS